MRRLILPLMFSSAALALLAACEDGPSQVYSPSPPGAPTTWNNSNAPGQTGDAGKDFNGAGTAGQNANVICNPEKKKAVWSNMLKQPFYPPSVGGNLDIAGGVDGNGTVGSDPVTTAQQETWTGLTLDKAEKINCQSSFAGDAYGDGSFFYAAWGDNGEVQAFYRVSNRQIYTVYLTQGYLGQMDAKSRDGKDTFTIKIDGSTLLKNNAAFIIDWADVPTRDAQVNEIYDALAATYSALGKETDCVKSGHCIVNNFGDQGAYMWFTPLGFTITVQTTNGDPKVGSTPIYVSQDKKKLLGYSFADILLQFDNSGTGPTATQKKVFGTDKDCNVRMDMPYSEFRDSCVAPSSDATKNKIEIAKLFGGFGHGDETFSFDVAGVDPNFAPLQPATLKDNDVVRDGDRPADGDPITSLRVDQEAGGQIRNDFTNNDTTQPMDWHGS